MRITIPVPDDLFGLADDFAKQQGLSRSELYATALREHLDLHHHNDLTERMNHACKDLNTTLPKAMADVARRTMLATDW